MLNEHNDLFKASYEYKTMEKDMFFTKSLFDFKALT